MNTSALRSFGARIRRHPRRSLAALAAAVVLAGVGVAWAVMQADHPPQSAPVHAPAATPTPAAASLQVDVRDVAHGLPAPFATTPLKDATGTIRVGTIVTFTLSGPASPNTSPAPQAPSGAPAVLTFTKQTDERGEVHGEVVAAAFKASGTYTLAATADGGAAARDSFTVAGPPAANVDVPGHVAAGSDVTAGQDVKAGRDVTAGRDLTAARNGSIGNDLRVGNNLNVGGDTVLQGSLAAGATTLASLNVSGPTAFRGGTTTTGDTVTNGNTTTTGTTTTDDLVVVDDAFIGDALSVGGATTLNGSLAVAGPASLGNTLAVAGDFSINTNKFSVSAATGNTVVGGTLGVTGDLVVGDNKVVITAATGNTAIGGTLNVTGATTLSSLATTAAASIGTNLSVAGTSTLSGNTSVGGTFAVTGATNLSGALAANGNVTLGDAPADTVTFGGRVGSHIIPTTNGTYDLGSPTNQFRDVYALNLVASNTTISGTTASAFTINSDAPPGDTESSSLVFFRGAGAPADGLLTWNATLDRFEFNQPVAITSGDLAVTAGNATISGNLSAGGSGTFTGQLNANGGIVTNNASINAGSGAISGGAISGSSAAVSGNTTVGGTLGVTGATTLGSTLAVTGQITQGGSNVCDASNNCGFAAGSGSNSYIQNQSATDQAANFRISGNGSLLGNLGIGTNNPQARLDVDTGGIRVFGDIKTDSQTDVNTFLGIGAGEANTVTGTGQEGLYNTFLGYHSGYANTTGSQNTATGRITLQSNTTGSRNTANGLNTLQANTTGSGNTASGASALTFNTTGGLNTANGDTALYLNTTGGNNTATGFAALYANTTGSGNTALGLSAGQANTTGSFNTFIGRAAGYTGTTANLTNATAIGYNTQVTASNSLILGNGANVGIGTTAPAYKLDVSGGTGIVAQFSGRVIGGNAVNSNEFTTKSQLDAVTGGTGSTGAFVQGGNSFGALATLGTNDANALALETNNVERLRIDTSGNVGIGTTNPQARLDVDTGGIRVFGDVKTDSQTDFNTFLGVGAGQANTVTGVGAEGLNNTFQGYRAGYANTTGYNNTANGYLALAANTTGQNNTGNGTNALLNNTTGSYNTANGSQALRANTTGSYNTVNGSYALVSNTTGVQNTATGYNALNTNTTGYNNTANGFQSLYSNTTGTNNAALGISAGRTNTTGSYNTFLGTNAGYTGTTDGLTNATAVGYNTQVTASNSLILGNGANVGIGTTAPAYKLDVSGGTGIVGQFSGRVIGGNAVNSNEFTTKSQLDAVTGGTGSTGAFIQNGNSFGALATLGTNDLNSLALETNNVERLRIDTSGNVGIGTTSPSSLLQLGSDAGTAASGIKFGSTGDTNLYRAAADLLKTDDTLRAGSSTDFAQLSSSGLFVLRAGAGSTALGVQINGESQQRLTLTTGGTLQWGDGTNPVDTNLYRSAADTLKTDDALVVQGALTGNGTATFNGTSATPVTVNRTTNDGTLIDFQRDGTSIGSITVASGTVSYNAFTGSHYGRAVEPMEPGMLASQTGSAAYPNGTKEPVYDLKPASTPNDPAALGSYAGLKDSSQPASEANPALVSAVGNGELWVADNGKNLDLSSFLISSGTKGHAMADTGAYPESYVIAKAAEPVDWSTVTETVNGTKHKKISVFFTQFVRTQGNLLQADPAAMAAAGADRTLATLKVTKRAEIASLTVTGDATVKGDLSVEGEVKLSKNRAGANVEVKKGDKEYRVEFADARADDRYTVNVETSWFTDRMIVDKDKTGFTVKFKDDAPKDAKLDWQIFAVADDQP